MTVSAFMLAIAVADGAVAGETAPGLEANVCYPNREAALAALTSVGSITIESEILIESGDGRELFDVVRRTADRRAMLLNSRPDGVACVLIEGQDVQPPTAPLDASDAKGTVTKLRGPDMSGDRGSQ